MINDPFLMHTLILLILTCLQNVVQSSTPPSIRTCEPIRLTMCKKLGYNGTGLPNLSGHETQEEAQQTLETFTPLIKIGCSSQLQFFLCSVYIPMCDEKIPYTLGPCRRLCETVRDRCSFILNEFGFRWPSYLNCSLFPAANDHQNMCMEGPGETSSGKVRPILSPKPIVNQSNKLPSQSLEVVTPSIIRPTANSNHSNLFGHIVENCSEFKFHQQYFSVRRGDNESQCTHGCVADILYPSSMKQFTEFWVAFWSTFCFASSVFTIFNCCRSSVHIDYPEKAIVFMAVNYLIYSGTHLVNIMVGRAKISCYEDSQYHISLLIKDGSQNNYCIFVFILLYYCQMSSVIWWLILSINLYFAVVKRISSDKLKSYFRCYHGFSWGFPAVGTTIIYVVGDISADELTGNCYVGNNSPESLLTFVIIPITIFLSTGFLIFIVTVKGFFRNRAHRKSTTYLSQHHRSYQSSSEKISYNNLSSQNSHQLIPSQITWASQPRLTEELGIVLLRLFIFQTLYFAISLYLLFVSFYEYLYRNSWYSVSTTALPNVEIMSLKIFVSFLAGIMTGIWIWMSEPKFPCASKEEEEWEKTSPPSLQPIPQHNHFTLPVSASFATLDSRGRYYHRGSETTV